MTKEGGTTALFFWLAAKQKKHCFRGVRYQRDWSVSNP